MQHKCQETYLCQLAVQIDVFGINFSDDFVFQSGKRWNRGRRKRVASHYWETPFHLNADVYYSNLRAPSLMTTSYTFGLLPNFFLNSSFAFSMNVLYNSSFTRLIVHPPNPPPMTREPVTPQSNARSFRNRVLRSLLHTTYSCHDVFHTSFRPTVS